jgi:hypothetical protein
VNELILHTTENKLKELAGSEFSLFRKLKIGGAGSMKMVHIDGLEFVQKFETNSKSLHNLSFELRPNSLVGRTYGNKVKTFFIKKEDLLSVQFESYRLRIMTKTGIVIRHEAFVEMLVGQIILKFYVPRAAYKPVKKFFNKEWLKNKTTYTMSASESEINVNAGIAEIILRLLGT